GVAVRDRRVQGLERQLGVFDVGRRLAEVRTRLVRGRGRLTAAITLRKHRADAQLRSCASRLEALSPMAVLGRGYAVCWNADRTAIIRSADDVEVGGRVRVTLNTGELDCDVKERHG